MVNQQSQRDMGERIQLSEKKYTSTDIAVEDAIVMQGFQPTD